MSITRRLLLTLATAGALAAFSGHALAEDKHDHGKAVDLGSATLGAHTVVAERHGDLVAGKTATFELAVGPAATPPKAVRLWVGLEDGKGSTKAKADLEDAKLGLYHAHVEVPAPLAADARLWVSVEAADGAASKGSFVLTPAAKK